MISLYGFENQRLLVWHSAAKVSPLQIRIKSKPVFDRIVFFPAYDP